MASSTINGSPGAAYNGALVSAITLVNGRPTSVQTCDVVVNGAFSLKVPAGVFQLKLVLNNNQNADRSGSDETSAALTLNTVTTDGVSTYQI